MKIKPCPSCGSDSKLRVGGPILGKRYIEPIWKFSPYLLGL